MPVDTRLDSGVLAAAEKLRDLAAQHAATADSTRRLAPEVVDALRASGLARHFVAARWGGTEGTFADFVAAVLTVSEGCAATGWCASLCGTSSRFAAYLPERGHQEIWGHGPDTLIATGLVPSGTAVPVAGGWRLTGAWSYVSGVEFADWALVCATAPQGGEPAPRFFALPDRELRIDRTWDSVGMRATGSHTLRVTDLFVPEYLSFPRTDLEAGRSTCSPVPGHNVPFQASGGLTFVTPIVGAATGALHACAAILAAKRRQFSADLVEIVRASGRVDAARHLVEQNAAVIDERSFTTELLARNQRNASFAAELAVDAVSALMRVAGTGGHAERLPLQRIWRDVSSAASHVALRFDATGAAQNYAAELMKPGQT